ncbi:hypothetical protein GCM10011348_14080 [Marinobacterium nitratireducens]|uniref:Sulfotransferase family protein n=1 Tax=Marinobacterium nitratireducens TaxID=518897 RepID=A0A917ZD24_9GAMM|nr:hypothetical protein [Marinobacterium nitratireducens]GGO79540.1 hypothetical protein GCM10011348_14080 [Marinobacterium nitratireducens]
MKELVLHFGVQRTGTTTIQSVLKKNKGILRSHGVLYPTLFDLPDHVKIPWWMKNNKISFSDVLRELDKKDESFIEKIVLSAEDFCMLEDFSFLREASDNYDLKIILYLKEQASWLESWYNQHIKWPWDSKFSGADSRFFIDNMSDFYWIDYYSTLSKIVNIVGKEKVIVNVVSKDRVKDTTRDFISHLGLDVERLHPYKHSNESLSAGSLEIVRRINLSGSSPAVRNRIITAVRSIDIGGDNGSKAVFSNGDLEKIYRYFEASNRMLAEEFFGGSEVFGSLRHRNEKPFKLSDEDVYTKYIPMVLKKVAEG